MTLHMTLTRPDLRAPEELQPPPLPQLDHVKVNKLPLEKPDLSLDGNYVSIWDTLPAVEESKMRRFLRKLKLK